MQKEPFTQIDIYEASSHISEIGAGIHLWKKSWEILKNVGLEDALLKFIPCPPDDTSSSCHALLYENTSKLSWFRDDIPCT